ncbi:MAG: HTH domain-containing protein [Synergistaceae bacterium]|jgi:response regulator of citrate/malate metabolism|nr:HTH domain-containing protein [Synergistaceae bacterium]
MKSIRLLIVEPDVTTLLSIGQVARCFDNYLVVDNVSGADEAIERMKVIRVDMVIIGGSENVNNWKRFAEFFGRTKFILLPEEPSIEFVQDAITDGVWDIILKPVSSERLRFSLEMFRYRFMHANALEYPVRQERLDSIFFSLERNQNAVNGSIKNSEMLDKVMQLIQDGDGPRSASEIAGILNVSRITVRKYCEALVYTGKLRVKNKYQVKGRPIKQYFLVQAHGNTR